MCRDKDRQKPDERGGKQNPMVAVMEKLYGGNQPPHSDGIHISSIGWVAKSNCKWN